MARLAIYATGDRAKRGHTTTGDKNAVADFYIGTKKACVIDILSDEMGDRCIIHYFTKKRVVHMNIPLQD